MSLRSALQRVGILPPEPPSDQMYHEASVENAMLERDRIVGRVESIAENGLRSDEKLREGIERIKASTKRDPMAELVRGMKSRSGVI